MPAERTRQYVFSAAQVRLAYVLGGVGAVAAIVGILLLATARPQGRYQPVDASQHQAARDRAAAALTGFELRDDGSVRLDIEHAMRLVVERGTAGALGAPADAAPPAGETAADAPPPDGAALYAQNCAACHQANGQGIPGAFPPLADHVGDLVAADRAFPIQVLLYGMVGPITVNGTAYNGLMPAFGATLNDAQIAALLEHVLDAWGDRARAGDGHAPYTAEDVAAERAQPLTNAQVHQRRVGLDLP